MKKIHRFSLGLVLLSLSHLANAQDEVVLTTGETLHGSVSRITTTFIHIQVSSSAKSEKIYADHINYVHLSGTNNPTGYYYSKKIISINTKEGPSVPRLLRLRANGKIKTYSIMENQGRNSLMRYFLEKDDSGLVFIGASSGFFAVVNDQMTAKEVTRQVLQLFGDNPGIQSRFDSDKKNRKRKVIHEYVREYNDWSLQNSH